MKNKFSKQPEKQKETPEKELPFDGETVIPGISAHEYERIRNEALDKAKKVIHHWRQKGNQLICNSCPFPHATFIPRDKRMIGEMADGTPIFEDCQLKK